MHIQRKTKNKAGFSLTELLVAILILSMVSAVVVGGIPVARDAYKKITVSANAQVLLSTTISALRSQIGTARIDDDESGEGKLKIRYESGYNGGISEISKSPNGTIMLQEYINYADTEDTDLKVDPRTLVPGTDDLFTTYSSIDYGDDVVTFNDLVVKRDGQEFTTPTNLSIRVIGNSKHVEDDE